MRITKTLAIALLSLAIVACSGIETRPEDTAAFAAKNYRYYSWRSEPLKNPTSSRDRIYVMDPIVRREVDKNLKAKGYILDADKAQFSVDYLQAPGLRMGEKSEAASNITPYPTVLPNRQVDGAVADNAHALGGVKETSNVAIQFNDKGTRHGVWQVIITKFVENVNQVDPKRLDANLTKAIAKGLDPLPAMGEKR
jgi:hypothetical protein